MQIVTPFLWNDDDDSSTLNISFNYLTKYFIVWKNFPWEEDWRRPLISTPTKNQLPANSTLLVAVRKTSFCPKRKSCLHLRIMLTYFKSSKRCHRLEIVGLPYLLASIHLRLNILTKSDRRPCCFKQLKCHQAIFSMGRKLPSLIANDPWLLSASSSLLSMQDDLNKIFSWTAKSIFCSIIAWQMVTSS